MTTALAVVAVVVGVLFVLAAIAPTTLVRLVVLAYPPGHPRRQELIAEVRFVGTRDRFGWVLELVQAAARESVPGRGRSRRSALVIAVPTVTVQVEVDVFAPGRRGPLPRGATRADVESAFPAWRITDVVVADSDPEPIARKLNFDERWYRLRRR
jgi:hypothetical protein